ncbi:hypothetical protein ACFS5O_13395 [Fictibacillus nanhaiensis]
MKKFAAGIIIASLAITAVFVGVSTKSVEQAEHGRTFSVSQKL